MKKKIKSLILICSISLLGLNAFAAEKRQTMYKCYNDLDFLNFKIDIITDEQAGTYTVLKYKNNDYTFNDHQESKNKKDQLVYTYNFEASQVSYLTLTFTEDSEGKSLIKPYIYIGESSFGKLNPRLAKRFSRGYCITQVVQY